MTVWMDYDEGVHQDPFRERDRAALCIVVKGAKGHNRAVDHHQKEKRVLKKPRERSVLSL
jgi:hypothetical protein